MPRSQNLQAIVALHLLLALFVSSTAAAQGGGFLRRAQELVGGESEPTTGTNLSADEVGGGLKDALKVGANLVVSRLGTSGGFANDPAVHIALPQGLDRVKSALDRVGMGDMLDELELGLNRAAEVAMPKAEALLLQAINDMTLDDAMAIFRGPDDAATRYFQRTMSEPLAREMRPVIDASLAETGAAQTYAGVMDRYNGLPFVRPVEADLADHVVQKGLDGVFHYLAQEEAAIRRDPLKRSTELLQRVFGN
jgi:hypothetical protein